MTRWIDPHWREFFKLHSTWVAIFWAIFYGGFTLFQMLGYTTFFAEHPTLFSIGFMFATITWAIARLTNQPGTQL